MANSIKELRKRGWADLWRDPLSGKLYTLPAALNIFRSRLSLPSHEYKSFRSRLDHHGIYVIEWQERQILGKAATFTDALRDLVNNIERSDRAVAALDVLAQAEVADGTYDRIPEDWGK